MRHLTSDWDFFLWFANWNLFVCRFKTLNTYIKFIKLRTYCVLLRYFQESWPLQSLSLLVFLYCFRSLLMPLNFSHGIFLISLCLLWLWFLEIVVRSNFVACLSLSMVLALWFKDFIIEHHKLWFLELQILLVIDGYIWVLMLFHRSRAWSCVTLKRFDWLSSIVLGWLRLLGQEIV